MSGVTTAATAPLKPGHGVTFWLRGSIWPRGVSPRRKLIRNSGVGITPRPQFGRSPESPFRLVHSANHPSPYSIRRPPPKSPNIFTYHAADSRSDWERADSVSSPATTGGTRSCPTATRRSLVRHDHGSNELRATAAGQGHGGPRHGRPPPLATNFSHATRSVIGVACHPKHSTSNS